MPERPDLAWVIPHLDRALTGQSITSVQVHKPVVLRMAVLGTPQERLQGRTVRGVARRLHFVVFDLDGPDTLVIHPMLAGRFELADPGDKTRKDLAVTFGLSGGGELRYRDDVRMGKVYVCASDALETTIPGYAPVGVDVLDPTAFTAEFLATSLKKRRDQIRVALLDKAWIDSLGNAYADEVLFEAGIHPKLRCNKLTADQVAALHGAVPRVLAHAVDTVAAREPALHEKVRDFLKVRNRKGEPCPTCGTRIRAAGVRGHDVFFCPTCQPDSAGTGFVDWRKARK